MDRHCIRSETPGVSCKPCTKAYARIKLSLACKSPLYFYRHRLTGLESLSSSLPSPVRALRGDRVARSAVSGLAGCSCLPPTPNRGFRFFLGGGRDKQPDFIMGHYQFAGKGISVFPGAAQCCADLLGNAVSLQFWQGGKQT